MWMFPEDSWGNAETPGMLGFSDMFTPCGFKRLLFWSSGESCLHYWPIVSLQISHVWRTDHRSPFLLPTVVHVLRQHWFCRACNCFYVCVCVCVGYPLLWCINHKFEPTKFNLSVLVIRVCIFGQDFFKTSILIFTTGHLHRGVNTCFRQLAIIRRSIISYQ